MTSLPDSLAALLLPREIARPVPAYTRYWITDRGRVFSAVRAPRVLRPFPNTKGYLQVDLWTSTPEHSEDPSGSGPVRAYVHALVLLAFVGPRPAGEPHDAQHVSGDTQDNRLSNLRYVSRSENKRRTCRRRPGQTKLDPDSVWQLRCEAAAWGAEVAAARAVLATGVSMRSALAAEAGHTWGWVPPADPGRDPTELADALGVTEEEAGELLALAPPVKLRGPESHVTDCAAL